MTAQRLFKGIVTPLITSFNADGSLYEQGIRTLVGYLGDQGIHGLFAVGSYGQFPLMTVDERRRVAEIVIEEARPRGMKVAVQVGSPGWRETEALARHAEAAGADAVASVVPFYYSGVGYSEEIILDHYAKLVSTVSVPVHFYNNPKTTGYSLTPAMLSRLIDAGVRGIKDSGADLVAFGEYLNIVNARCPEFDLMPGSGAVLLAGLVLGADACVAGTSAAFPELVLECYEALQSGDVKRAAELQLRVIEARAIQGANGLRAAACYDLLAMRGLDVGFPRAPWRRWTPAQVAVARRLLDEASLTLT